MSLISGVKRYRKPVQTTDFDENIVSTTTRAPKRRKKIPVPEHIKKDPKYKMKRDKNTKAAEKCRIAKRMYEITIFKDNARLKKEVDELLKERDLCLAENIRLKQMYA